VTRKIRVSEAVVEEIVDMFGIAADTGESIHAEDFVYQVGETVYTAEPFCMDRWQECASGIHCFLTLQEAVDW
jgi:hypothetical protein